MPLVAPLPSAQLVLEEDEVEELVQHSPVWMRSERERAEEIRVFEKLVRDRQEEARRLDELRESDKAGSVLGLGWEKSAQEVTAAVSDARQALADLVATRRVRTEELRKTLAASARELLARQREETARKEQEAALEKQRSLGRREARAAAETALLARVTSAKDGSDAKAYAEAREALVATERSDDESRLRVRVGLLGAGVTALLAASGISATAYLELAKHDTPTAAAVLIATMGIAAVSKLLGGEGGKKPKSGE